MHQLRSLSRKALTRLIKLIQRNHDGDAGPIIPFMSQEHIQACCFGRTVNIPWAFLMTPRCSIGRMPSIGWKRDASKKKLMMLPKIWSKHPKTFKKDSDWQVWSKNLLTYARSKQGKNNMAPLAYILREHNIPTPEMVFTNDIDEKIGHPCFQANSMLQIMLLYMACWCHWLAMAPYYLLLDLTNLRGMVVLHGKL